MRIIIPLLLISFLVTAHEFGHFLLAKTNGIGVLEFSVGMGPRLLTFKKGETRYSLKLIPFGGSCAMAGEPDGYDPEEAEDSLFTRFPEEKYFQNKSVWARISVIVAGPLFNFILAFVLSLIVIANVGINPAKVYLVREGSHAEKAGILEGDIVRSIDGKKIGIGRDIELVNLGVSYAGRETVPVVVERAGEKVTLQIDPNRTAYMLGISYYANDDPAQITITIGDPGDTSSRAGLRDGDIITAIEGVEIASGAQMHAYLTEHPLDGSPVSVSFTHNGTPREAVNIPEVRTVTDLGFEASYYREPGSFGQVVSGSFKEVGYWMRYVLRSLRMLVTGKLSARNISGPVGIVSVVDDIVDQSSPGGLSAVILTLLNFATMLSANLGVMNLLPIPALDGGRLLFLLIEAVRGKPVPPEKEGLVHTVGMVLLLVLAVLVLFSDVLKLL
ncbi:MAG: RIP metalloprotease RseP [Lachnospiraceae bacterium]|nr:RIP metalloprotease RseP [Lachnospiraceae bacterium]